MITEILNYVIVKKIGEGAMGQVFLAKNKSIHQFVAIKMLHPRLSTNPVLRDRFRQEAIMLSSLNHPNIVKFLNYVENEHGIFLIMEYVDGMTLEDYINKKTGLIVEKNAYPMMCSILDAFAYAHERSVIHRDIKPGNIFVTKEGNIKILDFGIAQIISESDNKEHDYSGTIEYMSPEQVQKHQLDTRSDIYSLGVVFHQMLTGRPPYDLATMSNLDIKNAIVSSPLGRMKEVYPYISDAIQGVVDRATQKNPDDRYPDCSAMKSQIMRISRGAETSNTSKHKPKKSGKWWFVGFATAIVIGVIGVLGYLYYLNNSERNYNDFVAVMGVPSGIGKASGTSDSTYYRIKFVDGRPVRATYVNTNGQPVEMTDTVLSKYKPVDTEYVYTAGGTLDYVNVFDRHGKRVYKINFDDDLCDATITRYPEDSTLVAAGVPARPSSYGMEYNDKGYLTEVRYKDGDGKAIAYRGVYGEAMKYDNLGRLTEVRYLDADYKPAEDETGIGILRFEYSGSVGNVKTLTFSKDGKPATPKLKKAKPANTTNKKKPTTKPKAYYTLPPYRPYADSVANY